MFKNLSSGQIYTLKCTAATVLAIAVAKVFVPEDLLSAAFVSALCVKPTFYNGLVVGREQFFASLIGGVITYLFIISLGNNLPVTAISLIIVIALCRYKKWDNYLFVAIFTVLYMLLVPIPDATDNIIIRMLSVFIGILAASFVNLILSLFRYKAFFYDRVTNFSNLLFTSFLATVEANKTADIEKLELIYSNYEDTYAQLSSFSEELDFLSKELKFRKKAGGIQPEVIQNINKIIQSLKMMTRYLQDIAFVSKIIAPNHTKINPDWKKKVDDFWVFEEKRLIATIKKINTKTLEAEFSETNIYEDNFIPRITEKIKTSRSDEKFIYTEFLALVTDFYQLHLTINTFDYFMDKYIQQSQEIEEHLNI